MLSGQVASWSHQSAVPCRVR